MSNKPPTTHKTPGWKRMSGTEQRREKRSRGTLLHLSKGLMRLPTGQLIAGPKGTGKTFVREKSDD